MLSKLYHPAPQRGAQEALLPAVQAYAARAYGSAAGAAPANESGTLGVCFSLQTKEGPLFAKTHRPGRAYQQSLEKEAVLLRALYGGEVLRDVCQLPPSAGGGEGHTLLVMAHLQPLDAPPAPQAVAGLIAGYGRRFSLLPAQTLARLSPAMPRFADILRAAHDALARLQAERALTRETARRCRPLLARLSPAAAEDAPHVLCHGDLSGKNILQQGGRLFVIDWEDAFWGPADYDFYYWLTFLAQRGLYAPRAFAALPVQNPLGCAYMAAVALVKCHLALLDGSGKTHRLSCEDRLCEILALEERIR